MLSLVIEDPVEIQDLFFFWGGGGGGGGAFYPSRAIGGRGSGFLRSSSKMSGAVNDWCCFLCNHKITLLPTEKQPKFCPECGGKEGGGRGGGNAGGGASARVKSVEEETSFSGSVQDEPFVVVSLSGDMTQDFQPTVRPLQINFLFPVHYSAPPAWGREVHFHYPLYKNQFMKAQKIASTRTFKKLYFGELYHGVSSLLHSMYRCLCSLQTTKVFLSVHFLTYARPSNWAGISASCKSAPHRLYPTNLSWLRWVAHYHIRRT